MRSRKTFGRQFRQKKGNRKPSQASNPYFKQEEGVNLMRKGQGQKENLKFGPKISPKTRQCRQKRPWARLVLGGKKKYDGQH